MREARVDDDDRTSASSTGRARRAAAATAGPRSRRKPETPIAFGASGACATARACRGSGSARELGIAESTAIYLYGLDLDEVGLRTRMRRCRPCPLPDGSDDRHAPGRAASRFAGWTSTGRHAGSGFGATYVHGRFGTPKSKRSTRSIPLADGVARELELLFKASLFQADEDLVFAHPHTGEPLDRSQLLKRFKAALKRAGVREIRFHDLRHTFGTRMAAAGVPMRTLQEWMGHRDFKTTLIYADYAPAANEAELINAAFARGASINLSINVSETDSNSKQEAPVNTTDAG